MYCRAGGMPLIPPGASLVPPYTVDVLHWLLGIDIIGGPVPIVIWVLTAAVAVTLLIRRLPLGQLLAALIAALAGAVIGVAAVLAVNLTHTFGEPLPATVAWWLGLTGAVIGLAVVSLWRSPTWRKAVAIALIPLALASATLGINAVFGLNTTLGSLFGVTTADAATDLGGPNPETSPSGPAYQNWTAPADLPTHGRILELTGQTAITPSAGYHPRNPTIYLPPAYGLAGAPPLPLMVMMMGKPGNPDLTVFAPALDEMAAKNKGLGPVVIVIDQLAGDPSPALDPACADSTAFGGLSTYVNTDVVAYAKSTLRVSSDPKLWSIVGYSNGGACAFAYAAAHPDTWGNLIDIAGDLFPGSDDPAATVNQIYGGDQSAYDAAKPEALLARMAGRYADHHAVFTAGTLDPPGTENSQHSLALAEAAGFTAAFVSVPNAPHYGENMYPLMAAALEVLYPVWGLSAP